jgi:hypothetical protein
VRGLTVFEDNRWAQRFPWGKPWGQTAYSQPIPKTGIGGSPRFAAYFRVESRFLAMRFVIMETLQK